MSGLTSNTPAMVNWSPTNHRVRASIDSERGCAVGNTGAGVFVRMTRGTSGHGWIAWIHHKLESGHLLNHAIFCTDPRYAAGATSLLAFAVATMAVVQYDGALPHRAEPFASHTFPACA